MASSGKARTTMAKLKREATLRERRVDKAARKLIRKQTPVDLDQPDDLDVEVDGDADLDVEPADIDAVAPAR
jgi:hypothetical protein